jgi:protein-disulfide isomerase
MQFSQETTDRITQYLHDKFGFPSTTRIVIATNELVDEATCYRKITVRTEGNAARIQTTVYLSPDQRFLSRELMDTTVDLSTQIQKELQHVKAELAEGGPYPTKGPQTAGVTVTVFSDFQCPFCRQEAAILKNQAFTEGSGVKLVFRNLPLDMHPWARDAAEMAACVYQQSNLAFWDVHDALFQQQPNILKENVHETIQNVISQRFDVDRAAYEQCVKSHTTASLVDRDLFFARRYNIGATPTIFVNGQRHDGVANLDQLQALILHERAEAVATRH